MDLIVARLQLDFGFQGYLQRKHEVAFRSGGTSESIEIIFESVQESTRRLGDGRGKAIDA